VALALSRMQRVNRIMELAANQFTILETMTPSDFMDFRGFLNPASGFQSAQFRVLEARLGLNDQRRVLTHYRESLVENERAMVDAAAAAPSLFDVVQRWLESMPFMQTEGYTFWTSYQNAVKEMLERDRSEVRHLAELEHTDPTASLGKIDNVERSFMALFDADAYAGLQERNERRLSQRATLAVLFIDTYRNEPLLQTPYRFLDAVIELDRLISLWRYRHTMMVTRMIGMRVGTGGSTGYDYLMATTLKQRVFDDLLAMSSYLIPGAITPPLPEELRRKLQFVNETK
jgi:tryptophan 2,3-dioxygenase